MMYRLVVVCGLLGVIQITGCATALRGTRKEMTFKTDPPDASVCVDGKCHPAPATVKLKRNEVHDIVVLAPGYRAVQFQLESQWDGASLPNLVVPGGSLLLATDAVTGADRSFYDIDTIHLDRLAPPVPATSPSADQPTTQPLTLRVYRGKLLTEDEYDAAIAVERADRSRFFGDQQ